MSNYTDLKTALQTLANEIGDDVSKYRALILIDQYVAAVEQLAYASKTDILNYSHTGITVGRRPIQTYHDEVNRLFAELNAIMYGAVTYSDFRSNEDAVDDVT